MTCGNMLVGLCLDGRYVYIADSGNSKISVLLDDDLSYIKSYALKDSRLGWPLDVCIDVKNNTLHYVSQDSTGLSNISSGAGVTGFNFAIQGHHAKESGLGVMN